MSADELLNVLHSSKRVSSVPMRLVRVVCQFVTATDYVKAVVYYFEECEGSLEGISLITQSNYI